MNRFCNCLCSSHRTLDSIMGCFIGSSSPAAGLQLEGHCLLHPEPPASCRQDLRPVPRCPGRCSYRNGVKPHGAHAQCWRGAARAVVCSKTLSWCWLCQTWSSVPSSRAVPRGDRALARAWDSGSLRGRARSITPGKASPLVPGQGDMQGRGR